MSARVGRNDPCPCGSGKQHRTCCLVEKQSERLALNRLRRIEADLIRDLFRFADECYGDTHFLEGWEEFTLWRTLGEDIEHVQEFSTTFPQWYLFRFEFDPNQPREGGCEWPPMPVALAYLERNRDRLDAAKCRFIEAASRRPYSFYRVSEVEAGRGLTLCDVFTGDVYRVTDPETSREARAPGLLYTSILPSGEMNILMGCAPVLLSPYEELQLLDLRDRFEGAPGGARVEEHELCNYDIELRLQYFDLVYGEEEVDGFDFEDFDSAPLHVTSLYFELCCSPRDAFERLRTLATGLRLEELLGRAVYDEAGELQVVSLPWLEGRQRDRRGGDQVGEPDEPVAQSGYLGLLTIAGAELVAEVTSAQRAEQVRNEIEARLGEAVRFDRWEVDSFRDDDGDASFSHTDSGGENAHSRAIEESAGERGGLDSSARGAGEAAACDDSGGQPSGDDERAWADEAEDDGWDSTEDFWDEVDWGDEDENRVEQPVREGVAAATMATRKASSTAPRIRPTTGARRTSSFPPGLYKVAPEMAEIFWRNWPDEKSRVLHDRTPREAVATRWGRERVEILLRSYEWAFEFESDAPFAPDLAALRRELGLLK